MIRVRFVLRDGEELDVNVDACTGTGTGTGFSVMEIAKQNDIEGIFADCGGACVCATCHVYVDQQWLEKLPIPSEEEADMLFFVANRQSNSRLSCQIILDESLDGLRVSVP